jgi:hypothetical protein
MDIRTIILSFAAFLCFYFCISIYKVIQIYEHPETWIPEFRKESKNPVLWIMLLLIVPIRSVICWKKTLFGGDESL